MAEQLDFFFFLGSTYAYLSIMRIEAVAAAANVAVRWRPFSVRELVNEQGNNFRNVAPRMAYLRRDIARRAAMHGLPFAGDPIWPTDPDQLTNRVAAVAARDGWGPAFAKASVRAWFIEAARLGDVDALRQLLRDLGRLPEAVIAEANSSTGRALYAAQTQVARDLGVFGSPTFAVGREIFWGDDRLEEAVSWAAGRHPAQHLPFA